MRCRRVIRLLSPYIDGELDEKILRTIERHTRSCSHCKAELDSLSLLKRLVSQKERLSKNGAFLNRLRWRLKEGSHLIGPRWIIEAGNFAKRLIPVPLLIMIVIMALIYGRLMSPAPVSDYMSRGLINPEVNILQEQTDSSFLLTKMIFQD